MAADAADPRLDVRARRFELRGLWENIMGNEALSILDKRTQTTYEIPIDKGPFGPWTCARSKPGPTISGS